MEYLAFGEDKRASVENDSAGPVVAHICTQDCGASLTRADLEKLRDWCSGRLEETKPKPQPGEVWELKHFPGEYLVLGPGAHKLVRVAAASDAAVGDLSTARANLFEKRVGRIVYDDE